ncbi:MAG TPA: aromatic-ring-hydroxylating dioxygenase subunit beta [Actinospica sp.]|nr:aromatic-ring-hydroxylating dioxygenase subunit beta [Actinospica sp.]
MSVTVHEDLDAAAYERLPFPEPGERRRDLGPQVAEFYTDESAALDERRYADWLGLLAEGFAYQVPVPLLREDPRLPRHSERALLFEATKRTFAMKFGRVGRHYAWSDRPGANVRHFVSGVRVFATASGALRVHSNVLACWNRGPAESATVSAERLDLLRQDGPGEFAILRRRVLLDAEIPTHEQLSIIL